ncbi:hypothetical protein L3Q82_018913, partial [Scortum barcoo]
MYTLSLGLLVAFQQSLVLISGPYPPHTEISDVVPGICWSHSSSLGVTALSTPITRGITDVFTPHILSNCSLSPWYFSSFSCSFFLMLLSFTTSISTALFCYLSTTTMSGWFIITCLSVCIWKSHRILARPFSTTFGDVSHFDLGTSVQIFLYTMPATWLWRSMYALPASILHPAVTCWIVSGASLHSLRLGSCLVS